MGTLNLCLKMPEKIQKTSQAKDDRIHFQSFVSFQASYDTSLEYPQGVLWETFIFDLFRGPGIFDVPCAK